MRRKREAKVATAFIEGAVEYKHEGDIHVYITAPISCPFCEKYEDRELPVLDTVEEKYSLLCNTWEYRCSECTGHFSVTPKQLVLDVEKRR